MWNRWWARIPVSFAFGVLSMEMCRWLASWVMDARLSGTRDFSVGVSLNENMEGSLYTVAFTILISEIYSSLRQQPIWTVSYLIYFGAYSCIAFSGLLIASEVIGPMPIYYYPAAIIAFAAWAGVHAARTHAKRRIRRLEATSSECS